MTMETLRTQGSGTPHPAQNTSSGQKQAETVGLASEGQAAYPLS